MFKKNRVRISSWNEDRKVYIAKQLTALHVKFSVVGEGSRHTEYYMKVSEKQLAGIAKYIVPMSGVWVQIGLDNNYYTILT